MPMGRLLRLVSLTAICIIAFSTPLFADGVRSFADRADSYFDKPTDFTDAGSLSFGSHASSDPRAYGLDQDHWNWILDLDGDHDKGRRWHHHLHYKHGDGEWNFVDQDWDSDSDGGQTGTTGAMGGDSIAVPEPTVLVLLSAAFVAFLLRPLANG